MAFDRVVEGVFDWIVDNSDKRRSVLRNQGNGYGVTRAGFDEGERAVERVDAPEVLSVEAT